METFFIPTENDFRKWIKEAVRECLEESVMKNRIEENKEQLINRKETAKLLRVSLVTLTDWMKRGLPFHKQRGKVYFIESEVMDYIKRNKLRRFYTIT
ncbi:MAG TPA: helix-turn-helix domain-containing protein [Flavisolibacter sp.]|nr:helix-turn-helix domain-containing protein [Flavisolibacter sp.]